MISKDLLRYGVRGNRRQLSDNQILTSNCSNLRQTINCQNDGATRQVQSWMLKNVNFSMKEIFKENTIKIKHKKSQNKIPGFMF